MLRGGLLCTIPKQTSKYSHSHHVGGVPHMYGRVSAAILRATRNMLSWTVQNIVYDIVARWVGYSKPKYVCS